MLVKVKKINAFSAYFVILLTFTSLVSCKSKNYYNYEVNGSKININETFNSDRSIEQFIAPFRTHINKDLDSVLAYCPENLDKSKGKWETNIGLFMANVTYDLANPIFMKRENKLIDICLLNHGGIRSLIPKGNVTTRTAFNVMPFENSVVVIGLSGLKIRELAEYITSERKPHPLHGLKIYLNKSNEVSKIEINNLPIDDAKTYYVVTSDYLANGGDSMTFFVDSQLKYDLDYKLRNLLIDYFKKVDTIELFTEKIVIEEN
ncbi:MAG: 2',3'-cyclic-nucleotide 2'-phosphodiesterase (5'-nucleotidase family) [Flavobacterium sp.]|jgi:2',3'-cyclic-nucleotide 2'-phosphodiesterase (5'-nucleotidase family)